MMQKLLLFVACLLATVGKAQELQMTVTVDASRLNTNQATERAIFTDMQKAIANFMNNQRWTSDDFRKGEQIRCELQIILLQAPAQNTFEATAQIRATRPIYNTTYNTKTLDYVDKFFNFSYVQGQPIIYSRNVYNDELSTLLAFYANVILAMDYDSFSKHGGAKYVEEAFNILNIVPSTGSSGWDARRNTINRYWVAENLQSQQMLSFREAFYNYHRLGLDIFLKDPEKARAEIEKSLEAIDKVNKVKPAAVYTNIFFDAKGLELINIFQPAPMEMRRRVHTLLVRLDPNKAPQYNKLIEQ